MKTENPKIEIRGEPVELTELRWKDALSLAKRLGAAIVGTLGADNKFLLNRANIEASIIETEGCLEFAIQKSTGKPAEWVDSLTPREAMPLIAEIVAMNFDRQFADSVKGIASKITNVFVPEAKQ
jgi:hypothetical protein